jgi:diacylglycerol kinase family enzyme
VAAFLLVNPHSGDGTDLEGLKEAAGRKGVRLHELAENDDPAELARAADATAIGMAAGDGSLAPVAEVALAQDLPFVCIPFGTRNHFARDLGLDRDDPVAALEAFDGGTERRIDVGAVNDRVFLNNVSLGIYAKLVRRREHRRRRKETLARLRALWLTARERHGLSATIDGEPVSAHAIFVGNNAYDLDVFNVGARERLDEGVLHLYTLRGLLPRHWDERKGREFTVDAEQPRLEAALDGEPVELETPLRLEIRPQALRVLLPPGP